MDENINFKLAREKNHSTLGNDAFFLINKKILRYFNGDWELCGFLSYFLSIERLCILEYKGEDRLCQEGFFFKQKDKIEKETFLHFNKQTNIINRLVSHNLIEVIKAGRPAKNYYKINHIKLQEIISLDIDKDNLSQLDPKSLKNQLTSQLDSKPLSQLDSKPLNNNILNNNTSNKKENTSTKVEVLTSSNSSQDLQSIKKDKLIKSDAEQVFDYWNTISNQNELDELTKKPIKFRPIPYHNKTHNGKNSKLYQRAIHLIEIRLTRFTKEEIGEAIGLYADMLSKPDEYKLKSKYPHDRMGIVQFFKLEKKEKDSMKTYMLAKYIDSWFDECVKGKEYLKQKYGIQQQSFEKLVNDQYPTLTAEFKRIWSNKMKKDSSYINGGGNKDENCFRNASILLMEIINKNYLLFKNACFPMHEDGIYGSIERPQSLVYDFIDAIDYNTEDFKLSNKITPGWLCSAKMEERLIQYYREKNIINYDE